MSVAFDAVSPGSAGQAFSNAASTSWSHTASGANSYVRVAVAWHKAGASTATVTYGGTSMTSVGIASNAGEQGGVVGVAQLFELINPPTGSQTVTVTFSAGGNYGVAGSVSYTGVNQATASGTAVTATGSSATASVTVTGSAVGNMVGDCMARDFTGSTLTANQTARFSGFEGPTRYAGGGQDAAGAAAPVIMSWSLDSVAWAIVAADIKAAANAHPGAQFKFLCPRGLGNA